MKTEPETTVMTMTNDKDSTAAAVPAGNLLRRVRVADVKPGINPRMEFDEEQLRGLASTFAANAGPVQPPVVYWDEGDGKYALIAGERRWRAAGVAGLEEMDVIVRARPSEKDQRKMALVENKQRQDLTPLEEALAVMEMLAMRTELGVPVYSRAQLAMELGVDANFIPRCEALMRCSERLRLAVHRREVEFRLAALVGSLPQALHELAEGELVFRSAGPLTVAAAALRVADYRRDLRKAQFPLEDTALVPGLPPCALCEFNGSQRSDVEGKYKGSVCLNPVCYDQKQAAWVALGRRHADDGQAVMVAADKVGKVFSFDGVTVRGDSGYVAADARPDDAMLVNPNATVPVWDKILAGLGLKVTLATDGQGRLRRLYDAGAALTAACSPECEWARLFRGQDGSRGAVKDSTADVEDKEEALIRVQMEEAQEKAMERAVEYGRLLAGQEWMVKVDAALDVPLTMEVMRLVIERLTAPEDRQWMACVMGGDARHKGEAWAVILEDMQSDTLGDVLPVLALALVARTMRLQGPAMVEGVSGELCALTGYQPKAAAALIEKQAREAAEALVKPRRPVKAAKVPEVESLPGDADAEPVAKVKREAQPEQRARALAVYLDTGSIKAAAEESGASVAAVRNWHLRDGWKAKREGRVE